MPSQSKTEPSAWMWENGQGFNTEEDVWIGPGGWWITHENGTSELLYAMTGIGAAESAGTLTTVTNHADGDYATGTLTWTVVFSEAATLTGTPQLTFDIDGTAYQADYATGDSTDTWTFTMDAAVAPHGALTVDTEIDLDSGDIENAAGISFINKFPSDYVQPTINIIA